MTINNDDPEKKRQGNAVDDWWNLSRNKDKWDVNYDDFPIHSSQYLISRQTVVLNYLDELLLEKGAKVLELGYGGGQTALEILKRGYKIYGIDISKNFSIIASERCQQFDSKGDFEFKVGSIESKFDYPDNFFDAVVVVGALQYLHSPDKCLKEVNRVLKSNSHFIVAQRNIYSLSNFMGFRELIRTLTHFILREQYELFPSFKSIFIDSKMGVFFKYFKNSKFFNNKFMLKGHDVWKFDIKKRLYSYFSLKSLMLKNHFSTLKKDGAYYAFSENEKFYEFNIKFDKLVKQLKQKNIFAYLFTLGRSIVILARKNG